MENKRRKNPCRMCHYEMSQSIQRPNVLRIPYVPSRRTWSGCWSASWRMTACWPPPRSLGRSLPRPPLTRGAGREKHKLMSTSISDEIRVGRGKGEEEEEGGEEERRKKAFFLLLPILFFLLFLSFPSNEDKAYFNPFTPKSDQFPPFDFTYCRLLYFLGLLLRNVMTALDEVKVPVCMSRLIACPS